MTVNKLTFRNALGKFATGVTVVTGISQQGELVGITVNSFTSLSLDPPLVLFCIDNSTPSFSVFEKAPAFALNVLSEDQQAISNTFATPLDNKFENLEFDTWETGSPILHGCLANLECRKEAIHDGGDHKIIVGRVEQLMVSETGRPLLYFQGKYGKMGDAE